MPLRKTYFVPAVINPEKILQKDKDAEIVDTYNLFGDIWIATSLNEFEARECYPSALSSAEMVDPASGEIRPKSNYCLMRNSDKKLYYDG